MTRAMPQTGVVHFKGRLRSSLVASLAASVTALSLVTFTPAEAAVTQFSGVVTAADGSGPIQYAHVCGDQGDPCVYTEADGSYVLPVSRAASYTLTAETIQGDFLTWTSSPIWINAGMDRTINITLVRGASISGDVKKADGTPAYGPSGRFRVTAHRLYADGSWSPFDAKWSTANYSYSVRGLPPGKYKLLFHDDTKAGDELFARQWYPAATSASGATTFTVTGPQAFIGNDMTLSPPGKLTLNVLRAGKPAASRINVYDADGRLVTPYRQDSASVSTATGLRAGTYTVKVFTNPPYYTRSEWYSYKLSNTIQVRTGEAVVRTYSVRTI